MSPSPGPPLDNNIATAGLCRIGYAQYSSFGRSLNLVARFVGIITGSPGRQARDLAAGNGQARDRTR